MAQVTFVKTEPTKEQIEEMNQSFTIGGSSPMVLPPNLILTITGTEIASFSANGQPAKRSKTFIKFGEISQSFMINWLAKRSYDSKCNPIEYTGTLNIEFAKGFFKEDGSPANDGEKIEYFKTHFMGKKVKTFTVAYRTISNAGNEYVTERTEFTLLD